MRRAIVAICLLVAFNAAAGSITSLNPSSITVKSGEHFLTVNGSGLSDSDHVVFDGPAGQFDLEINAIDPTATSVAAWVPLEIVNIGGTYSVYVTNGREISNKLSFVVVKPGRLPFKLHLPELLLAPARSRLGSPIEYEVSFSGGEGTGSIDCSPKSGSDFPFGKSVIRCYGTDQSGQKDEGEIEVTIYDSESPSMNIPKDFEVPGEDERGAYVKYDVSAFDEIDGELKPACFPESGTYFPNGRTRVSCEATDNSLNPVYGTFDVMVRPKDIGRLELKLPDDMVVDAEYKEGAYVKFDVAAYGTADPDPVVTCEPESGRFFEVGRTKVYCVATDDFDQRAEGGFIVEVKEGFGLKLPSVNAEAMSASGAEVTFETKVDDWTAEITCSPSSGSLFALGATEVECQSTDDRGRNAKGTFTVTVADTIAPHIGRVQATAGSVDRDLQVVPVAVDVEASDLVDLMPRCSVAGLVNETGGAFDWRVRSDLELEVNAEPAFHRAFRIQVSCVDAAGNRSTETVGVNVPASKQRQIKTN